MLHSALKVLSFLVVALDFKICQVKGLKYMLSDF